MRSVSKEVQNKGAELGTRHFKSNDDIDILKKSNDGVVIRLRFLILFKQKIFLVFVVFFFFSRKL